MSVLINLRALTSLVVARFQAFGEVGYEMTKGELGILHADCSSRKKAVTIAAYFGYQLIAMMNLHAKKGWKRVFSRWGGGFHMVGT